MKKILIFGKQGQIGWELQRSLTSIGTITALDRTMADLCETKKVREIIQQLKPNIIVNAAAYTAVDKAESEPDLAMLVNGIAPGVLAEEAKRLNATLVHYSTDYVFDGSSTTPYREEDSTNPINIYGKTKLAGEKAIQTVGGNFLILRTSWVYGMRGKNFLLTMLKLAQEKDTLKIVMDQIGAPTWCRTIAEATGHILAHPLSSLNDKWGIYNLTAGGQTSWCDFAATIFKIKKEREGAAFRVPQVIPIPSSEFPSPASRPKFSALSHSKVSSTFSLLLPDWKHALESCLS